MRIIKLLIRAHEYCFYRISNVFGNKRNADLYKGALIIGISNSLYLMVVYLSLLELKYNEDYIYHQYRYIDELSMVFAVLMIAIYYILFNGKYYLYKERWQNETKTWKFVNGWLVALYIIMPILYVFIVKG